MPRPTVAAGIELARSLQPRVILLDVMMPDLDGWAVLKALKADSVTADIPVVIVSFVAEAKLGALARRGPTRSSSRSTGPS